MALSIPVLKYFLRTAEQGSISRAAKSLGMSQPALSHHMAALELYLGVQLLIRGPKGIMLTDAGAIFLRHAHQIIRYVDQAESEVRDRAGTISGTVALGLLSSISPSLTPLLLKAVRARFPKVMLNVAQNSTDVLRSRIESGRLDLAISLSGFASSAAMPLFREELYLVGAPGSFPEGRKTISFAEVANYLLFVPPPGFAMRSIVESAFANTGAMLRLAGEIDGSAPMKAAIAAGVGFAVLSWVTVQREVVAGELAALRIVRPHLHRTLVLDVYRPSPVSRASLEIERLIVEAIAGLLQDGIWQGKLLMKPAAGAGRRHRR